MLYPYWRLSLFYLFYYACLGTWIPFWPLYLEYLGHTAFVIGVTTAIFNSTRIIAPNIWGYLGDRTDQRLRIIRYGCFLGFVTILGMLIDSNIIWISIVLFVFSFFWGAVLPQFEVVTLNYMGAKNAQDYGRIRLWGSIGFVVAVVVGAWVFDILPLAVFPSIIAGILFLLWISSLVVPENGTPGQFKGSQSNKSSFRHFLAIIRQRHILGHLICVLLLQISFGPYYTFFSIYLVELGYPIWSIGAFWALAITGEVIVFINIRRLFGLIGIRNLMMLSLLLASLRWLLLGSLEQHVSALALAQILHAFSFGAFHACMIESIRRQFPIAQHGKAQAMFNSFGYGVGAVFGAAFSGMLWSHLHGHLFYLAATLPIIAIIVVWFLVRKEHFVDTSDTASSHV